MPAARPRGLKAAAAGISCRCPAVQLQLQQHGESPCVPSRDVRLFWASSAAAAVRCRAAGDVAGGMTAAGQGEGAGSRPRRIGCCQGSTGP